MISQSEKKQGKYRIAVINNNSIDYEGEYNTSEEAISKIKYLEDTRTNPVIILIKNNS